MARIAGYCGDAKFRLMSDGTEAATAGSREALLPRIGYRGSSENAPSRHFGEFDVRWHYREEEQDEGPKETVYCDTCGPPVHIVLSWGDI